MYPDLHRLSSLVCLLGQSRGASYQPSVEFKLPRNSQFRFSALPWTTARQASLSITKSQTLLKLMSIELMMPSNLQPSHPLSSPSSPAFNLSQHQGHFQ